jgi:hypothetical protein
VIVVLIVVIAGSEGDSAKVFAGFGGATGLELSHRWCAFLTAGLGRSYNAHAGDISPFKMIAMVRLQHCDIEISFFTWRNVCMKGTATRLHVMLRESHHLPDLVLERSPARVIGDPESALAPTPVMNETDGNANRVQAAGGHNEAEAVEQSTFSSGQFAAVRIAMEDGEESDEHGSQHERRAEFHHDGGTQENGRRGDPDFHAGERNAE